MAATHAIRRRRSPPDEGYARVRQAIVGGHFQPNERLVEADLAERFKLGRAAVRTALARLEQDGLVEREPFRGARVRSISVAEAVEVLEARAVLEGLVARHAATRATPADVAALRATLDRMAADYAAGGLLQVSEGSSRMHHQLVEIAGHGTAARLIDGLHAQNVRYQFRTILAPGRGRGSVEEHRAIVAAVAAGDAVGAEAAARRHVERVAEALRAVAQSAM